MADNSVMTDAGQFANQFNRMAAMLRCAMPGTIGSFDPATQRATVQPGIRMKVVQGATVTQVDLPPVQDVPIVMPYGFAGNVLLTHPIKAGDPCLIVISDRSMENFLQSGSADNAETEQSLEPTTPRAHHLSDAICIPGLIADPQVVPEWNQDNIELRTFDRKVYFSLGPEGIEFTDGVAKYTMKGGKVTLDAPAGIEETSEAPVSRITSACHELVGTNINIGCNRRNSMTGGAFEIGTPGGANIIHGSTTTASDGTYVDTNGRDSTRHIHSGIVPGPEDTGPTSGNA